jgi:archaemetzincin
MVLTLAAAAAPPADAVRAVAAAGADAAALLDDGAFAPGGGAQTPTESAPQARVPAPIPPCPLPFRTNRSPPADRLWRPPVDVEDDPPAFYARTHYRERGLARTAGGWDAHARGWIASFHEFQPQALRPTRDRHTIDLVPLGDMTYRMRQRTRRIREFLEVYLTLPVRMREPVPVRGRPFRTVLVVDRAVRQYEAGDLKDRLLVPRLRPDTFAMIGITAEDMYSTQVDWDCVGNQTSTGRGFAVCSLARLFPEFHNAHPTAKAERRGMDLAMRMFADAAVGMLGPTPCRKYYCIMNQAKVTSMKEPLHLCPDCLRKLRWSLGFDPIDRYQALRRFYCRIGALDEARWVLDRLKECVPAAEAARSAPPTTTAGPVPSVRTLHAPAVGGATPAPEHLYRPDVDIESDPPGFYTGRGWRERGLSRNAGGFDADAREWIVPFRAYVASEPLRPTRGRHTIYLLPLGPQDEKMAKRLGRVRDFLAAYFTLPVRTLPPAPLEGRPSRPATVAGRTVPQYAAEALLDDVLEPSRPPDALAVVGLATQDLYSAREDWPSAAHVARTGRGLAVVSLARTFPAFFRKESTPDGVYREVRLAFGMAADATGRALGLTPCRKYFCVMNQARRSSTREPLHLCPDCLRKMRWTLGFDPAERYETLGRFYEEQGLPVEATWVRRRMADCRKALAEADETGRRNTE